MKKPYFEIRIPRTKIEQFEHSIEEGERKFLLWTCAQFESYFYAEKQITQLMLFRAALRRSGGTAHFGEFDFRDTSGDTITVVYQPSMPEVLQPVQQDHINSRVTDRTPTPLFRPIRRPTDHRAGPMVRSLRADFRHPASSQYEPLSQPAVPAVAQR